jgi:hypothetical protein
MDYVRWCGLSKKGVQGLSLVLNTQPLRSLCVASSHSGCCGLGRITPVGVELFLASCYWRYFYREGGMSAA